MVHNVKRWWHRLEWSCLDVIMSLAEVVVPNKQLQRTVMRRRGRRRERAISFCAHGALQSAARGR